MKSSETKFWVKKAQRHDKNAFTELMQLYMKDMYRIAIAILMNEEDAADLGKAFTQGLDDLDAIIMGYANVFFQKRDYKTTVACIEWLRSTLRPGYPPETTTWFDKYDCVLLVLCAETCCAMGDLGSARDYLTKAAKQAAWFDGVDSSKICESKLFAEMGIMNQTHYDNFGRTAMEAAERRVMTDAEFVPQLPAIWAEIRKDMEKTNGMI